MNKKAQIQFSLFFSVLVAIMLFIGGMLVVNFIKTDITTARTANTCSAPATDGTKALCLLFDFVIPYFFVLIISVAGGIVTEKFLQ